MDKRQAKAGDWTTKPMPEARGRLALDWPFTAEAYAELARGHVPRGFDDLWFTYLEGDTLSLHRTWTGSCIFQVRFEREGDGYVAREAWVNRDPTQFQPPGVEEELDMLRFLLRELPADWREEEA